MTAAATAERLRRQQDLERASYGIGPRFDCTACGHRDDADVNAAKNILALARTGPSGANGAEVVPVV